MTAQAKAEAAAIASAISGLLGRGDHLVLDGVEVDLAQMRALYEPRGYAPLWAGPGDRGLRAIAVLTNASAEGLDPAAYGVKGMTRRFQATSPKERAELDVLLSQGIARYAQHVHAGVQPPDKSTAEIAIPVKTVDGVRAVREAAQAGDIEAYLASLPPQTEHYRRLRKALAQYRAFAEQGGWEPIPDGPTIKLDMSDPAVVALRRRLAITGELAAMPSDLEVFDAEVEAAVKVFQARHGLTPDGALGPRTRAALNVDPRQRMRQIAINMERLRWMPDHLGERYVMVNIAGYWLELIESGKPTLEMPVIVGQRDWQTPVFSARIRQVVFNPAWNVPDKIAREEVIPKGHRDGNFFAREGIGWVRDTKLAAADGQTEASDADQEEVGGVRLRQAPGPKNPLGRIKFNMPNAFDVYLHDTPSHNAFNNTVRALSHGCVRVGDAKALAGVLMSDMPDWNEERRDEALAGWDTRIVSLHRSMPVHITYLTAFVDDAGQVQFRDDIYRRDGDLLRAYRKVGGGPLGEAKPKPAPPPDEAENPAPLPGP
jgi:L,D-transpeptidase YcbB